VVDVRQDILKPLHGLPLESKSGTHNKEGAASAHEFTKAVGRSSGNTLFAKWKAQMAKSAEGDKN
jgi:hypothetical protein